MPVSANSFDRSAHGFYVRSPHGFRNGGALLELVTGGAAGIPSFRATHGYTKSGRFVLYRNLGGTVSDIAISSDGSFYTAQNRSGGVTTRKYSRNGTEAAGNWPHDHGANLSGIAVDMNGYVYITGTRTSGVTTRKLNPDGTQAWSYNFAAGSGSTARLCVDKSGHTFIVGTFVGVGTIRNVDVVDSSGNLALAVDNLGGAGTEIAVDLDGNIIVGTQQGAAPNRYMLHKLDSSGSILWQATPTTTLTVNYGLNYLAVGPSGDIYAGFTGGVGAGLIRKYDSGGNLLWSVPSGSITGLAVDSDDRLFATGNVGSFGFIRELDSSDGSEIWRTDGSHLIAAGSRIDVMPGRQGAFG